MVSEKKIFLRFSHYKSMEADDPWGMANLDPRDLIVRIYVGDHVTLLHTKNTSGGPLTWFQRRRFLFFMFVCVEVLRPSQPNGVMSSAVSLPNHTFTGQA